MDTVIRQVVHEIGPKGSFRHDGKGVTLVVWHVRLVGQGLARRKEIHRQGIHGSFGIEFRGNKFVGSHDNSNGMVFGKSNQELIGKSLPALLPFDLQRKVE